MNRFAWLTNSPQLVVPKMRRLSLEFRGRNNSVHSSNGASVFCRSPRHDQRKLGPRGLACSVLAIHVLSLLQVGCSIEPTSLHPGPANENPRETHDFGFVEPGERITHTFTIHNHTDTHYALEKMLLECECIDVKPSTRSLRPGQDCQIRVGLDVPNRSQNLKIGIGCQLRGEDGSGWLVQFAIAAQVREHFHVYPRMVDWQFDHGQAIETKKVLVSNHSREKWAGISVDRQPEDDLDIQIEPARPIPPAIESWNVWITPSDTSFGKGVRHSVVKVMADDGTHAAEVQLRVRSSPWIRLMPDRIFVISEQAEQGDLALRFRMEDPPVSREAIRIRNPFPENLSLEILSDNEVGWRLRYVARRTSDPIRGVVEVAIPHQGLHAEIPVFIGSTSETEVIP